VVLMALFVGMFIYRPLHVADLPRLSAGALVLGRPVLLILGRGGGLRMDTHHRRAAQFLAGNHLRMGPVADWSFCLRWLRAAGVWSFMDRCAGG